MSQRQINEIFDRIRFDNSDIKILEEIYSRIKSIAEFIDAAAPDSAEKTLAFRKLHEAAMYSGRAISQKEKYKKHVNES